MNPVRNYTREEYLNNKKLSVFIYKIIMCTDSIISKRDENV
jgi:hypothetical protein